MSKGLTLDAVIFFASIAAFWAFMRTAMIKDDEGRSLPPNLVARAAVVVLYLVGCFGLVALFSFGKPIVMHVIATLPNGVEAVFRGLDDKAPFLALIALFGLNYLGPYREAERASVLALHSMKDLHGDTEALVAHLQSCTFRPSTAEIHMNLDFLAKHNVYLTDANTQLIDLSSVQAWRKVTTMLRLLSQWNVGTSRVLSKEQMGKLAEIERTHIRKTKLATDILKNIAHQAQDTKAALVLGELRLLLADTPHSDRRAVEEIEAKIKALIAERSQANSNAEQPLRLSAAQLRDFIAQIDGYFRVEYQILLGQLADLTARSVIYARDSSAQRLKVLKDAGFTGLGKILPVTFDRVLWTCMTVTVGYFVLMYITRFPVLAKQPNADPTGIVIGFIVFGLTMSLAALVGGAAGSSRRSVEAESPPWGIYVLAGCAAVLLFFAAQSARLMLTTGPRGVAPGMAFPIERLAPWAIIPFVQTLAICRLARVRDWWTPEEFGKNPYLANGWERAVDGAIVALMMFFGYALAIIIHDVSGLSLPPSLLSSPWSVVVFGPTMMLGFLIGFVVVRDARVSSKATIIATNTDTEADAAPILPPMPSARALQIVSSKPQEAQTAAAQ